MFFRLRPMSPDKQEINPRRGCKGFRAFHSSSPANIPPPPPVPKFLSSRPRILWVYSLSLTFNRVTDEVGANVWKQPTHSSRPPGSARRPEFGLCLRCGMREIWEKWEREVRDLNCRRDAVIESFLLVDTQLKIVGKWCFTKEKRWPWHGSPKKEN